MYYKCKNNWIKLKEEVYRDDNAKKYTNKIFRDKR